MHLGTSRIECKESQQSRHKPTSQADYYTVFEILVPNYWMIQIPKTSEKKVDLLKFPVFKWWTWMAPG